MSTHHHDPEDIDPGGYCNRLVMRNGYGDVCGAVVDRPVHWPVGTLAKAHLVDRSGTELAFKGAVAWYGERGVISPRAMSAFRFERLDRLPIVHHCPHEGFSLTPCCRTVPFELDRMDRLSVFSQLVTCRG